MLAAYGRPNCGFYDSSLTNGGPDPNPELRPNGKPRKIFSRKRRQVEDEELRFDETKPLKGLTQITKQFRVWSERHQRMRRSATIQPYCQKNEQMDKQTRKPMGKSVLSSFYQ